MEVSTAVCVVCAEPFSFVRNGKKPRSICSIYCKRRKKNEARSQGLRGPAVGTCRQCGVEFGYDRRSRERIFCTTACKDRQANARRGPDKIAKLTAACLVCGSVFEYPWQCGRRKQVCSPVCRAARKEQTDGLYRIATAASRRAYTRQWYRNNTDRSRAYHLEYERRNASRVRARSRAWAAANKTRVQAMRRAWVKRNPLSARLVSHRRRARLRQATLLHFTKEQLMQRLSMWRGCWICGDPTGSHIDHVKPIAKGGAHALANLRPICAPCNSRKSDLWPLTAAGLSGLRAAANVP